MKYVIALIIIAAGIGGFMYLNNKEVEAPVIINGTDTTVVNVPDTTTTTTSTTTTSTDAGVTGTTTTTTTTTPAPKSVTVSYTDAGFSPTSVTINKGDTVTFTNNSNGGMYVASGPHPQHTNYPEFDAKKSYAKGESYTFKFEKVGTWPFHNHLNPTKTGTIIVK